MCAIKRLVSAPLDKYSEIRTRRFGDIKLGDCVRDIDGTSRSGSAGEVTAQWALVFRRRRRAQLRKLVTAVARSGDADVDRF
jgi:hypothetical protein